MPMIADGGGLAIVRSVENLSIRREELHQHGFVAAVARLKSLQSKESPAAEQARQSSIAEPLRQQQEAPSMPKIWMEPLKAFWDDDKTFWGDDIQFACIPGANEATLGRVEVHAWHETTTVYDKDNRMIVRWDKDLDVEKGEAWKNEYEVGNRFGVRTDVIKLKDGPVEVIVAPQRYTPIVRVGDSLETGKPGELNHVHVLRTEIAPSIPLTGGYEVRLKTTDRLTMFAITEEDAEKHPDRKMPEFVQDNPTAPEDFSDHGYIGHVLRTETSREVLWHGEPSKGIAIESRSVPMGPDKAEKNRSREPSTPAPKPEILGWANFSLG